MHLGYFILMWILFLFQVRNHYFWSEKFRKRDEENLYAWNGYDDLFFIFIHQLLDTLSIRRKFHRSRLFVRKWKPNYKKKRRKKKTPLNIKNQNLKLSGFFFHQCEIFFVGVTSGSSFSLSYFYDRFKDCFKIITVL